MAHDKQTALVPILAAALSGVVVLDLAAGVSGLRHLWSVPAGAALVFFLPGWVVLRAAVRSPPDGLEIIALSTGLSLALVGLTGLALHALGWLTSLGWATALAGSTALALALGRSRSPEPAAAAEARASPHLRRPERFLLAAAAAIAVCALLVARHGASSQAEFSFTELWLVPTRTGHAIGIANHEHKDVEYDLEVRLDGSLFSSRHGIRLANAEEFTTDLALPPSWGEGPGTRVEVWLFKDGNRHSVHRKVWSTTSVKAAKPGSPTAGAAGVETRPAQGHGRIDTRLASPSVPTASQWSRVKEAGASSRSTSPSKP